jgi:hypothetical protein
MYNVLPMHACVFVDESVKGVTVQGFHVQIDWLTRTRLGDHERLDENKASDVRPSQKVKLSRDNCCQCQLLCPVAC